ncbi:hypothetical protein EJ07DRAFT_159925 [Lizonia empirigonia]|nr:hypothetical protein EJ07DRAFT_159925 [Lizonia empirigonia]
MCTEGDGLYESCTPNLACLRSFELVSAQDVWDLTNLKQMLWSCTMLRELTLLVGGRTSKIPLSGLRPLGSSIEVLIVEARLFSITPALNYQYTVDEVNVLLRDIPSLRVIGMSVEPSRLGCSHALLSAHSHLQILHLRNWLTPGQVAQIAESISGHLSVAPAGAQDESQAAIMVQD